MRDAYHEELDSIGEGTVEMARLVGSAVGRATTAMLDADLKLAEAVIAADQKVDDLQHELEARAIALLARQQPVATDLRIVVTSLRMSADLERSGDWPSTSPSWRSCASRTTRCRRTCTPRSWRWASWRSA